MVELFNKLRSHGHKSNSTRIRFDTKVVLVRSKSLDDFLAKDKPLDKDFIEKHKNKKLHHDRNTRSNCKKQKYKYGDPERYNYQLRIDYHNMVTNRLELECAYNYKHGRLGNKAIFDEPEYDASEDSSCDLANIADTNAEYNSKSNKKR